MRHAHTIITVICLAILTLHQPCATLAADGSPRNIIFILSDDHRFDFMGFHPGAPRWLETPALDRMAREGAHFVNAFVSTSLCSPSRASILTGQYMHHHKIVDNQRPQPVGTRFFPADLQTTGYQTAYVGKWHMGHDHDQPRPGFNHWVSYKGQGTYTDPDLNINGKQVKSQGYETDVLTDLAIQWLAKERAKDKPFFLYLSFKAPHYPFQPAPRHKGIYRDKPIPYPQTMARTEQNLRTQPKWVKERRYSIHGIDHMETGKFDDDPVPDFDDLYRSYAEAVHSVDENVGKVLRHLDDAGLSKNTLVIYMGDNGFHLGEHGFYDKRDAFEPSMRVPLLAWAPGLIEPGTKVQKMVQNIDIAPTILEASNTKAPATAKYDGRSWLPLAQGKEPAGEPWRDHILYEYHWEWNFPATPTLLAIRTDRYKYVYYHGTWDIDSFHDLKLDPHERHNLISSPDQQERIAELRKKLFDAFEASNGLNLPLRPPAGDRLDQRKLE